MGNYTCPDCGVEEGLLHEQWCMKVIGAKIAEKNKLNENPLSLQVGGDHYKSLAIQPIEYIVQNGLGWCEGNIVKYISRWKQKGGVKDIDKVIHYAQMLKELASKDAGRKS